MRKTLALAVLLSGCVTHERYTRVPEPPPPPSSPPPSAPPPAPPSAPPPAEARPAPPPRRTIDEREAVQIAARYVRSRGLEVERFKARLDPQQHWRVEVRGDRSGDRARVLVDGVSGRVLRAKLNPADGWNELE
jgi:hypothetical protein